RQLFRTMKNLLTIILLTLVTGAYAFDSLDSISVDSKKMTKIIKEVRTEFKKQSYYKVLSSDKVSYTYPKKILDRKELWIDVTQDGTTIFMIFVNLDDYSLGQMIDLR